MKKQILFISIGLGVVIVGCNRAPKAVAITPAAGQAARRIQNQAGPFLKELEMVPPEGIDSFLKKNLQLTRYFMGPGVGGDPKLAFQQHKRFTEILQSKRQGRAVPSEGKL